MIAAAHIFSCAAEGDAAAEAACNCFVTNTDCLAEVCEIPDGKGKGKGKGKFMFKLVGFNESEDEQDADDV